MNLTPPNAADRRRIDARGLTKPLQHQWLPDSFHPINSCGYHLRTYYELHCSGRNMKTLIQTYQRRQLRKFAKSFTSEIKSRFGKKVLYSAAEVEEVAVSLGVSSKEREWAYGMFAEEEACQGFLTRLGSSKTARELRSFLSGMMFGGGTSVGYEGMWNRFDDPDDTVMGGLSSGSGSSFGGSSGDTADGGFDSGGSDGGSSD